jgi:hypothetical protein
VTETGALDDLTALAGTVRKTLHWSAFLLAAMLAILVIDLQLKRSIARQAIAASELIGKGTDKLIGDLIGRGTGGGRTGPVDPPADDGDHPGGGGGDHVDGSPGVAAADDHPGSPGPGTAGRRPGSRPKRPPRDG